MKWILFTGTWRLTSDEVEKDVREAAREVIARGDGVLTGGATGVDYFAMNEVLNTTPPQHIFVSSFQRDLRVTLMIILQIGVMNPSKKAT